MCGVYHLWALTPPTAKFSLLAGCWYSLSGGKAALGRSGRDRDQKVFDIMPPSRLMTVKVVAGRLDNQFCAAGYGSTKSKYTLDKTGMQVLPTRIR